MSPPGQPDDDRPVEVPTDDAVPRRVVIPESTTPNLDAPDDTTPLRLRRGVPGPPRPGAVTADAFGTAALRAAVLGAWRVSPARLREDANTEEDHARGYYRDRVVVELAQNAADAATRAGVPGRLLLRLARTEGDRLVLVAANTGAPLDADGVASLASMRASAKRDDARAVGRFGVGFAAVRSVADEISVLSTTGGLRFSVADTAELLAESAAGQPGAGRRGAPPRPFPAGAPAPVPRGGRPADRLRHRGGPGAAGRGRGRRGPLAPARRGRPAAARAAGPGRDRGRRRHRPGPAAGGRRGALDGRDGGGRAAPGPDGRPPGGGAFRPGVAGHVGAPRGWS